MDEAHLGAALRYVALNPVRAGLAARATDWRWSSVHALLGAEDGVTATSPVAERYPDFAAWLASGEEEAALNRLRKAESVGRPIGDAAFLGALEAESGRALAPGKRGRRSKSALSP